MVVVVAAAALVVVAAAAAVVVVVAAAAVVVMPGLVRHCVPGVSAFAPTKEGSHWRGNRCGAAPCAAADF